MILLSHPTGNEFVRNALIALDEAGLLREFWTCINWNPDGLVNRLLPSRMREELMRRSFPSSIRKQAKTLPWREMGRLIAGKLHFQYLVRHEHGPFSVDAVYRSLDVRVAGRLKQLPELKGIYAYEDGAFHTFYQAHELGLKCIYDLPLGYWRAGHKIYKEEAKREPQWAVTLIGNLESEEKLFRKDEELKLADIIVVPSTFVKETLEMAPQVTAPVEVIPFGAPTVSDIGKEKSHKGRLRVLYVGALRQRKGLSYLLKAVSKIKNQIDLTLIGSKPCGKCLPLEEALKKYRWIASLSHQKVLEEMRRHDVFVFPSLFEGFALVILEAMSQGLPVIITPNTGGADVVTDGEDGFVIPIRSAEAIAEKLELLAHNPDLVAAMSYAAQRKAAFYMWEKYRKQLVKVIKKVL